MNSYINSTIFKKLIATLSGLFLVTFLIGHLIGNLQLIFLSSEIAQKQFNEYALFMTTNPMVKLLSYLTYISIIIHVLLTITLSIQSKQSRDIPYQTLNHKNSSSWISRNMSLLGVIIFIFILVHMKSFWYEMHFGEIGYDSWGNKDLYSITVMAFQAPLYTLFYIFSILIIGMHLYHGIASSFQTIGLKSRNYINIIERISKILTVAITIGFVMIPIVIYFRI